MWYRIEFQSRNSSHVLGNDPGILDKTAELYAMRKADHPDCSRFEEELCGLMDQYVSAMNPSATFQYDEAKECIGYRPVPSEPHPCSTEFQDTHAHYTEVFNSVQRHFCYSQYCIRDGT
jgi:hypothetical protein